MGLGRGTSSGGKITHLLFALLVCYSWLGARCDERHLGRHSRKGRHGGSVPLVRRQRPRRHQTGRTEATHAALAVTAKGGTEVLLPRRPSGEEAQDRVAPVVFESKLLSCNETEARAFWQGQQRMPKPDGRTLARQRTNMRSLVEVADTLRSLGVPVVLLGGTLLGWRRGCLAAPGDEAAGLGVFGPWLASVGLERLGGRLGEDGHSLDAQRCRQGPLSAGCGLRITLGGLTEAEKAEGGVPHVDIEVFFSAPPVSVGRMPGRFNKCQTDVCGRNCQRCPLAYGLWSITGQARFYACPVPVGQFQLVAWMNHTFWAPAALEQHLVAEYGEEWPVPASEGGSWPGYRPCQPYSTAEESFSQYPSSIPGLRSAAAVLEQQEVVERKEMARIGVAAAFEQELWGEAGTNGPPWRPRLKERLEEQQVLKSPWRRRVRVLAAGGLAVAAATACLHLGWRCVGGGGCERLLEELEKLEARTLDSKVEKN